MSGMDGDYGGSMDGNIEHTKVKGEVRMDRDIFERASAFNGGKNIEVNIQKPEPAPKPEVVEDKLGIEQLKKDVKNFSLETPNV